MANVLLINPQQSSRDLFSQERHIPLSILYLSASLKKGGHEAKFIDISNMQISSEMKKQMFDFDKYYKTYVKKTMVEFQPDVVGISVHYAGRFKSAVLIANDLKADYPSVPIVIGGIHPTIFPKEILDEYKDFDFVLQGESEETMVQLVNALENINEIPDSIDGLAYRENGKVIVNSKRKFISKIDNIPFPDYDMINITDYYFDTSKWINPRKLPINVSIYILSSRSCPHQCSYCSMFLAHGPKYRMRSANNVLDEIEMLYNEYNHRYFSFMDDNFTLNKRRTLEICSGIIDRGLNIQFDTPNGLQISTLDDEVIEVLVQAGMVKCCLAIESGSTKIRKKIGKRLAQEKIYSVFESIRKYPNLAFNTFFIIGFPDETFDTLEETYLLIMKLRLPKAILSFATPFPGTELFDECIDNNLLKANYEDGLHNMEDFYYANDSPFIKPYALNKHDLIDFRLKVYRELSMTKELEYLAQIN